MITLFECWVLQKKLVSFFGTNLNKGTNCWLIIKIRATIIIELINPFSNLLGLFVIHLI
jgi:hypothetical protein